MCLNGALVVLYVAVLLAAAWLNDAWTIYCVGYTSSTSLHPASLNTTQLRNLLDARGVPYAGILEKSDLVKQVLETGNTTRSDLEVASALRVVPEANRAFTQGSEFYEVVEDTKDSVWLVQVLPPHGGSVIEQPEWDALTRRLSAFDVRFGTFHCTHDVRFCRLKEWTTPRLILALPRGYKAKADIFMRPYAGLVKSEAIYSWIASNLALRIRKLKTSNDVEEWFDYEHNPYLAKKYPVRLLYVSSTSYMPIFFSALTVKYTGRVRFGMMANSTPAASAMPTSSNYFLSTPEQNYTYGSSGTDLLNLRAVSLLLSFMVPDANDILVVTCVLINALCITDFFTDVAWCSGTRGWRVARGAWLALKCNAALAVLCITLSAAATNFALFSAALAWISWVLRWLALSRAGDLCRKFAMATTLGGWVVTAAAFAGFVVYSACAGFVVSHWLRARHGSRDEPQEPEGEAGALGRQRTWLDALFRHSSPSQPAGGAGDPEEGLQAALLIERLSVPSFWLQPYSSYKYIDELPVWHHEVVAARHRSSSNATPGSSSEQESDERDEFELSEEDTADSVDAACSKRPAHILRAVDCAICLERYSAGDALVGLPCGHGFHQQCITHWLCLDNTLCPVCRWPAYKRKLTPVEPKAHDE